MILFRAKSIGILLLLALTASPCLARTWTDKAGHEVEGTFVRINQGQVTIQAGRRTLQVPIAGLSDKDIAYLRKKVPKSKQGDLPAEVGVRTWTDIKGRAVEAAFVRIEDNDGDDAKVILRRSKDQKEITITLASLSPEDQAFLQRESTQENKGHQLPLDPMAIPLLASNGNNPSAPNNFPVPNNPAPPALQPFKPPFPQPAAPNFPQPFVPHIPPPVAAQPPVIVQPPIAQTFPQQPVQVPSQPFPMQPPVMAQPPAPPMAQQELFFCMKCKKQIPANVKAGDSCPHCGTFFDYKESAGGHKEYAPASSWAFSSRFMVRMVIVVVSILGGALVKYMRGE
jgi:hypothetical protein